MRFVFDFSTLFGVKTKSQKLHIATSNVTDLRFLLVEFQEKFLFSKQLSAKAESFYLSSLQSNSTLGRFTTALGLSADSPIPAGSDLHSSRCAHGDHSADKQNDASSVCPIANTPNTSVRYTEDPHTLR